MLAEGAKEGERAERAWKREVRGLDGGVKEEKRGQLDRKDPREKRCQRWGDRR